MSYSINKKSSYSSSKTSTILGDYMKSNLGANFYLSKTEKEIK